MRHPNDIVRIAAALVLLAASVLRSGVASAEQHIVCPPSVRASQIIVTAPKGWVAWYLPDAEVKLDGAGIMLGPIRMNGVMQGETFTRKDGAVVNQFKLTGGDVPILEKWMACNYGATLFQAIKLPINTKECSVIYQPVNAKKDSYKVSDIVCK